MRKPWELGQPDIGKIEDSEDSDDSQSLSWMTQSKTTKSNANISVNKTGFDNEVTSTFKNQLISSFKTTQD